jgi:hypothetical protein
MTAVSYLKIPFEPVSAHLMMIFDLYAVPGYRGYSNEPGVGKI